jgi:hypothetical protein
MWKIGPNLSGFVKISPSKGYSLEILFRWHDFIGILPRPARDFGQKCRDLAQAKRQNFPRFAGIGIRHFG